MVSDINGLSAREMVAGLIDGKPINTLLDMARGRLKMKREDLQEALDGELTARHQFVLKYIHAHIDILERDLAELDAYLLTAMAPYQWAHRLLQTIPGIDQIASALILIEIGDDMTRFGSANRLAAWAALCPGNNESAGKRKSGHIGKGSSVIRYILCECANSAWKTKKFTDLEIQESDGAQTHKKAIVALAHKIIRLIYVMLTRKVAYHDPQIDYEAMSAKKNAPRWIKQLKMISKWPGTSPMPVST